MRNPSPSRSAFTLIELLVVIAIIGLISTLVLSQLSFARTKSQDARRLSDMQDISKALSVYYLDYDRYPATLEGNASPAGLGGWETSTSDTPGTFLAALHPYLPVVPVDPVNRTVSTSTFTQNAGDYYYAYYRYADTGNGNGAYKNCPLSQRNLAIIAFHDAGIASNYDLLTASCGALTPCQDQIATSPGGILHTCRIWNTEFSNALKLEE